MAQAGNNPAGDGPRFNLNGMGIRTIAREARLETAIKGLAVARSRANELPATLVERQRKDYRSTRYDSSKPAAVISTVKAISSAKNLRAIARSSGYSGYYGGGGYGGGGGGAIP